MSTDRELLELAAKAAGIKVLQRQGGYWMVEFHERGMRGWNPLLSDGDALRLVFKLKLSVGYVGVPEPSSVWAGNHKVIASVTLEGPESFRQAIVRAAAEIGKALP